MKIAIDLSQIVYETGVSRYMQSLIESLLKIDHKNEYILFGGSLRRFNELTEFAKDLKGNFKSRFYPIPPLVSDFLGNILHFPNVEFFVGDIDVFHSSDWTQPPSKAFKVTTVHDLAPILLPAHTHPKIVTVHKRKLAWVKKEVDRVIAPTNATKKDLVNLGFEEEKIRVVYEGVDPFFKPRSKEIVAKVKTKYGLLGNYFVTVGINPRKNLSRIQKAFNKLNLSGYDLLMVGESQAIGGKKNGDGDMLFAGRINDEDLAALYSGASALIYPSLYEGFGLPILEAFACECPVVTSNISSMAEVAGSAAVLVDPYSVDAIAGGMQKVVRNRSELVRRGKARVKEFSWESAARETLKIYQEHSL